MLTCGKALGNPKIFTKCFSLKKANLEQLDRNFKQMKKVKIIFAAIIGILIVFFCLRNIFYQARTEVVFALRGSKEVVGKIIKKEFSGGSRSTTYYITYEFSPEDSESLKKKNQNRQI